MTPHFAPPSYRVGPGGGVGGNAGGGGRLGLGLGLGLGGGGAYGFGSRPAAQSNTVNVRQDAIGSPAQQQQQPSLQQSMNVDASAVINESAIRSSNASGVGAGLSFNLDVDQSPSEEALTLAGADHVNMDEISAADDEEDGGDAADRDVEFQLGGNGSISGGESGDISFNSGSHQISSEEMDEVDIPDDDNVDADADGDGSLSDDSVDAGLDSMDPALMDEDQQIRYLERQHRREMRMARVAAQEARWRLGAHAESEAAAVSQAGPGVDPSHVTPTHGQHATMARGNEMTPNPEDDDAYVTPPTRTAAGGGTSVREARSMASAARREERERSGAASAAAAISAAGSSRVAIASSVRRTLHLESSADESVLMEEGSSSMTRSRSTINASHHLTPVPAHASASLATPVRSSHHASSTPSRGSSTTTSPSVLGPLAPNSVSHPLSPSTAASFSAETLQELGMTAEEAQALLAEQVMALEQARIMQRHAHAQQGGNR